VAIKTRSWGDQGQDHPVGGFYQGRVLGQGPRLLNLLDALLNQLTAAAMMLAVELLQLSGLGLLHGF
jgi:hypothetical protein